MSYYICIENIYVTEIGFGVIETSHGHTSRFLFRHFVLYEFPKIDDRYKRDRINNGEEDIH